MACLLLDTTFLIGVLDNRRGRADLMERLISSLSLQLRGKLRDDDPPVRPEARLPSAQNERS